MTALVSSMLVALSIQAGVGRPQPAAGVPSAGVGAFVRGSNELAFDLYAHLASRPGNLFFSPLSVHTAVAMAYVGARGATEKAMAATMHYPSQPVPLGAAARNLLAQLAEKPAEGEEPSELKIANALWGQQGVAFEPDFTAGLARDYGAGLRRVDFTAGPAARDTINRWVAQATRDRIRDIIQPGVLSAYTRLVVTNAIYFRGRWQSKFPQRATKPEPFLRSRRDTVSVATMSQRSEFEYLGEPGLQILRLSYGDGQTSMLILLPREVGGLAALERKVRAANLTAWLGRMKREDVEVHLPRFTLTDAFQLRRTLGEMGMSVAFSPDADFSGMSRRERLFISAVLHKAFVAVDEGGTEAAAATAGVMEVTAIRRIEPRQPVVFRADHPFLFLIRHDPTGAILFLGRVTDPQ